MNSGEAAGRSLSDAVIIAIRDMITRGELQAGSRLPIERDLAEAIGVSRGSLREGVRALVSLGVLETRQGDGTYVTALDASVLMRPLSLIADLQLPSSVANLLAVRRLLEGEAAALAAHLITDEELADAAATLDSMDAMASDAIEDGIDTFIEGDRHFHAVIARASGNPALAILVDTLIGRTQRERMWRAMSDRGSIEQTQREHHAILAALTARRPEPARLLMSVHILGVEEYVIDHPDAPSTSRPGS